VRLAGGPSEFRAGGGVFDPPPHRHATGGTHSCNLEGGDEWSGHTAADLLPGSGPPVTFDRRLALSVRGFMFMQRKISTVE